MSVGSDAMDAGELRQSRKAATVNLMFLVPSGRLTGALTAASKPTALVEPGCTIINLNGKDGSAEVHKCPSVQVGKSEIT